MWESCKHLDRQRLGYMGEAKPGDKDLRISHTEGKATSPRQWFTDKGEVATKGKERLVWMVTGKSGKQKQCLKEEYSPPQEIGQQPLRSYEEADSDSVDCEGGGIPHLPLGDGESTWEAWG